MADYSVRVGEDVDPYVRNLASEYITELFERTDEIASRVMRARERVAAIAVDGDAVNGEAHCRFRKFGFHFLLSEEPGQPANAKKRQFVLNFATKPKFLPKDMPRRLRKRNGKAVSARPTKAKKKRRVVTRSAARQVRRIIAAISFRLHEIADWSVTYVKQSTHNARMMLSVITNVSQRAFYQARTLKLLLYKAWRRRPRVALPTRAINRAARNLPEPPHSAPTGAWLERRHFDMSAGFALRLNVLASSEPPIDWDSFPFGAPPPESEQQAS
jgi:hypothetical protein